MSAAITMDTHMYVKRLREQGVSEPQAEALVSMVREVHELSGESFPTKTHVDMQFNTVDMRFTEQRTYLDKRLAEVKNDILRWTLPLIFGLYALIASMMLRLPA